MIDFYQLQSQLVIIVAALFDNIQDQCIENNILFKSVLLENITGNLNGNEKTFIELCYGVMIQCIITTDNKVSLDEAKLAAFYYRNKMNQKLANLQSQPQDDSEQDYQGHQAAIKGVQQQTAVEQSSLPVTVRKYSFLAS